MDASGVSDSTDWLNTSLPALTTVESALRCQVCKDFYTTPMITSCSHTFCSLCIRRCLATEGKCPTCRGEEQEVKLRKNWALQELVDAFQAARPGVMKLAQRCNLEAGGRLAKRKLDDTRMEMEEPERPSQARKMRALKRIPSVVDGDGDDYYLSDDGLVPCPICSKRMKEESVFLHLDRCGQDQKRRESVTPSRPTTRSSVLADVTPQTRLPQHVGRALEHLPKLNYSILKENALRKKLSELGLIAGGPRSLLEKRHTEWVHLWNANCDSARPKLKKELLQDLDAWERSQGGSKASFNGLSNSGNDVMKKDFDGAGWAKSHDVEFQRLIANARKKKSSNQPPQGSKKDAERIGTTQDAENGAIDQTRAEQTLVVDPIDQNFNLREEIGKQDYAQRAAPAGTPLTESNSEMLYGCMRHEDIGYKAYPGGGRPSEGGS
ncbi:hypothetical protein FGG08_000212 [Glutinoglossum americanum]|uniref:Postreplication repair E3 ubiquitin-protein ligase RAD18 n=1 Tax=Glutinoglossum americanum TaxID=1670608 RepID=A0A9P8IIJ0_9PEZI|nr:hypothetical protein FGG08_000212 [Glutinoglossum americanum]